MTRKLKEEKVLRQYFRDWMADNYTDEQKYARKECAKLITALMKAVREDERLKNQCDCDTCRKGRK